MKKVLCSVVHSGVVLFCRERGLDTKTIQYIKWEKQRWEKIWLNFFLVEEKLNLKREISQEDVDCTFGKNFIYKFYIKEPNLN